MIQTLLSEQYQSDTVLQTIPFLMKRYFNMKEYETICSDYIPSLPYKTIGLFFCPISYGAKPFFYFFSKTIPFYQRITTQQPNTTTSVSKKQLSNIPKKSTKSVTFSLKKDTVDHRTRLLAYLKPTRTPEIYKLCVRNQSKLKKIGYAHISSLTMNQQIKKYFQTENAISKLIVMCDYNSQFNKWSPVSIESDSSQVMFWEAYQQLTIQ